MAFDFPSSPTVGQQFSPVAGTTYTWNGYGWAAVVAAPGALLSTVTAVAAASVDFTSLLTSAYDEYEVHFSNVYSSSNADTFWCRIGQGGVYSAAASYWYALNTATDAGANAPIGSAAATGVIMAYPALVSNLAARAISGKMSIAAPLGIVAYKHLHFNTAYIPSSGSNYNSVYGSGAYVGNTNAIDSLRFVMNGNTSGTFKLYGIR